VFGLISSITLFFVVLFGFAVIFNNNAPTLVGYLYVIFIVAIMIFNISLFVRRWHDLGNSGWMVLLNFVPLINIFVVLNVIFKTGQSRENQYGKTPQRKISYPQDILSLS
jgi:uncharacterized membrane protein YhaH (DUF805 family)